MSEQPRDWDKELAEIDKAIARSPALPPPAPAAGGKVGAPTVTGTPSRPAAPGGIAGVRHTPWGSWVRVLLVAALAAGMTQWPYSNACGLNLYLYLGAIAVVVIGGVWSALSAWQTRRGWAHLVSLLAIIWGLALGARAILPRVGYAKVVASWTCG